jgi:hypothetical protein
MGNENSTDAGNWADMLNQDQLDKILARYVLNDEPGAIRAFDECIGGMPEALEGVNKDDLFYRILDHHSLEVYGMVFDDVNHMTEKRRIALEFAARKRQTNADQMTIMRGGTAAPFVFVYQHLHRKFIEAVQEIHGRTPYDDEVIVFRNTAKKRQDSLVIKAKDLYKSGMATPLVVDYLYREIIAAMQENWHDGEAVLKISARKAPHSDGNEVSPGHPAVATEDEKLKYARKEWANAHREISQGKDGKYLSFWPGWAKKVIDAAEWAEDFGHEKAKSVRDRMFDYAASAAQSAGDYVTRFKERKASGMRLQAETAIPKEDKKPSGRPTAPARPMGKQKKQFLITGIALGALALGGLGVYKEINDTAKYQEELMAGKARALFQKYDAASQRKGVLPMTGIEGAEKRTVTPTRSVLSNDVKWVFEQDSENWDILRPASMSIIKDGTGKEYLKIAQKDAANDYFAVRIRDGGGWTKWIYKDVNPQTPEEDFIFELSPGGGVSNKGAIGFQVAGLNKNSDGSLRVKSTVSYKGKIQRNKLDRYDAANVSGGSYGAELGSGMEIEVTGVVASHSAGGYSGSPSSRTHRKG